MPFVMLSRFIPIKENHNSFFQISNDHINSTDYNTIMNNSNISPNKVNTKLSRVGVEEVQDVNLDQNFSYQIVPTSNPS